MHALIRYSFVFLFAMLQGFAPLLHAHSGLVGGQGLHLPELNFSADQAGHVEIKATSHQSVTVHVADSVEKRRSLTGGNSPALVGGLPPQAQNQTQTWPHVSVFQSAVFQTDHLLPYPCAPPRA